MTTCPTSCRGRHGRRNRNHHYTLGVEAGDAHRHDDRRRLTHTTIGLRDCGGLSFRRLILAQIPADANEVISQLATQVGDLSKRVAILTGQLTAAMKLIPADVLEAAIGGDAMEEMR